MSAQHVRFLSRGGTAPAADLGWGAEDALSSHIFFDDPTSVWIDSGAKSLAYFCKRTPVRIDQRLLSELKRIARARANANVRLCLHDSPEASFHQMIILEHRGRYYRPHKHLTKPESYHVIEGSMAAVVFEDDGRVRDLCVLGESNTLVYRIGADTYHAVLPLSEFVLYHECKPGPFLGEVDSVYPVWAPAPEDSVATAAFTQRLHEAIRLRRR